MVERALPGAATKVRERPRRRELSREKLVAAAIELIDGRGVDALSMRTLADRVGVTPMALYRHFAHKRDLLAAIAAQMLAGADFASPAPDWRVRLRHCFGELRGLCLRHPSLPQLIEREGVAPVAIFAPMDSAVGALREAGLDDLAATRTYFLLVSYTLGQAGYQSRGPVDGLELGKADPAALLGAGLENVCGLTLPGHWDFDASFSFALDLIIAGVDAVAGRSTGGGGLARR